MKIVSGGQTGADRAALDVAIELGVPHGGWCPRGRLAEDGRIPARYRLQETPSADAAQRTEWNVRDSDATVVFSTVDDPGEGTLLTLRAAETMRRPLLHLIGGTRIDEKGGRLREFVARNGVAVLNVAGPRASQDAGVESLVRQVLRVALARTGSG